MLKSLKDMSHLFGVLLAGRMTLTATAKGPGTSTHVAPRSFGVRL